MATMSKRRPTHLQADPGVRLLDRLAAPGFGA
jgi:hypothetical protein